MAASSALVSGDAQIIEPQKPDSANAGPDAQKSAITRKILEQEFVERQQQADLQRDPAFIGGFAVPTKAHRYPIAKYGQLDLRGAVYIGLPAACRQ
jgi:hypothetical protein